MKTSIALACFPALLALATAVQAALTFSPSYGGSTHHSHLNGDAVIGFDWGSDGNMYYATATPGYTSGGVYRKDGASSTEIVGANSGLFAGAGVVAIGASVYYNDSDYSNNQFIRRYDIGSGTVTPTAAINYALGTDGTNLFTTGSADWVTTDILLYPSGNLAAAPIAVGAIAAGSSGPVALDAAGNLFYAPGYGDPSIYRWTAAEVATAISGGTKLAAAGHLFADYSAAFPSVSGASSLAVDAAGSLYVTLTDFTAPSSLVRFDADGAANEVVATTSDRLGGLNLHAGQLYVAAGNEVFNVIPEPASLLLSLPAILALAIRRRR